MEVAEQKQANTNDPNEIFVSRGINHLHGYGLDPLLFSHVKLMIRDVCKAQVVLTQSMNKNKSPYFKLYHRYISKVKITGFIIAVKIKDKYTMITVDDSTETINCKIWINLDTNSRNKWKIGDWVKIEGALNYFMDTIEINVAVIDTIKDPNEELLHWLECVNILKVLKKPMKFHINPPQIELSNNANMLLQLLHSNQIQKFQFKKLVTNYQNIKQFLLEILKYKPASKQLENQCLFKLRELIQELRRLNKIKLVDIDKDIYIIT